MMNNPGVLQQEKMDLDLEIPSSLVQTDGHLRRSNSAPMINGLRFNNAEQFFSTSLPVHLHATTVPLSLKHMTWRLNLAFQWQLPSLPERSTAQPEKQHNSGEQTYYGTIYYDTCKVELNVPFTQVLLRSRHRLFVFPAPGFIRSNK